MNNYKLYGVIDNGYRSRVRRALLSQRFPQITSESIYVSNSNVVSGELISVLSIDEFIQVSNASVDIGKFEDYTSPSFSETLTVSTSEVTSGVLRDIIINQTQLPDLVSVSNLSVISGILQVVVVNLDQTTENLSVSRGNIESGTLA